jgi:hypothetical protein
LKHLRKHWSLTRRTRRSRKSWGSSSSLVQHCLLLLSVIC